MIEQFTQYVWNYCPPTDPLQVHVTITGYWQVHVNTQWLLASACDYLLVIASACDYSLVTSECMWLLTGYWQVHVNTYWLLASACDYLVTTQWLLASACDYLLVIASACDYSLVTSEGMWLLNSYWQVHVTTTQWLLVSACDYSLVTGSACDYSLVTGSACDYSLVTGSACDYSLVTGSACDYLPVTSEGMWLLNGYWQVHVTTQWLLVSACDYSLVGLISFSLFGGWYLFPSGWIISIGRPPFNGPSFFAFFFDDPLQAVDNNIFFSGLWTVEVDDSVPVLVVSVFFPFLCVDPFPDTTVCLFSVGDPSSIPRVAMGVPGLERGVPGRCILGSS